MGGVSGSAGSEVDGEEIFHTPRRLVVRGPVLSGASGKGKKQSEKEALRMLIGEIRGLREDVRKTKEQVKGMMMDLRIGNAKW